MNMIFQMLKDHGTTIQIVLYLVVIVTIWTAEFAVTYNSLKEKWQHTRGNLLFIVTALPIQLALTFFVIFISGWVTFHHWGILYLIPDHGHIWIKYLCGFFLMDFFEYLYHVAMHKVSSFWSFHLVHHTDMEMDVSTTVREHPGETFIRVCFQMLWVFLAGASIGLLLLRQTVQTFANLIAHTHLQLPAKVEKHCGFILITPGLHHVHHHFELPYTDCNYGDVFSIWDRMFGTFKEVKKSEIKFGLDVYQGYSTSNFMHLIKYPFVRKK
jgi:sterol desaturase/sphingolipid hydroxylase (fatty acid hydroxylase superfamily)